MKFQFAIDRGGTFTDVFARRSDTGAVRVMKLLSEDPQNYSDAPREGIRRVLEAETGRAHPAGEPLDAGCIEWIRMGTTVATNALLERKGERCALLVTKGFRDLLFIGTFEHVVQRCVQVVYTVFLSSSFFQATRPDLSYSTSILRRHPSCMKR